jgi:hypothetical protein
MEEEKDYKICSTCKKKIGFFRKRAAKKQDKSGKFPIIQSQFCSPKCAYIGYQIFLEINDVKNRERARACKIIDSALEHISHKRVTMLRKYGSVDNVPAHELPLLYSGAYNLLEMIKEQIENGSKKKASKQRNS